MSNPFNRFAVNPTSLDIPRSRFERDFQHKTTFNAGKLIPFYVDEVLPGDTFSVDTALVCRMSTPLHPVMDNSFLDYYYFYVPTRQLWSNFEKFMGANEGEWYQPTEYLIPYVSASVQVKPGSVANYMGIPVGCNPSLTGPINCLPFRAYAKIWNEWFRDQNVMDAQQVSTGDTFGGDAALFGQVSNESSYKIMLNLGGTAWSNIGQSASDPLPVSKYHDYFTSALPMPQKGEAVNVPLGELAPVVVGDESIGTFTGNHLRWNGVNGTIPTTVTTNQVMAISGPSNTIGVPSAFVTMSGTGTAYSNLVPANLFANLADADGASVNTLRMAFQLQKLLERDARGGTRYIEILKNHFGVTSSDASLQRSEYLGGKRVPISMSQVLQTSATAEGQTPLGNTGAFSFTQDRGSAFTKSFEEHGYVIGVCCVRTEHTYSQGLEKFWSRRRRYDFYDPIFANIGEQPIYNKEIYALSGSQGTSNEVFGYQEAWADYRYKPNLATGFMSPDATETLASWHYGDDFGSTPTLSAGFMAETVDNIDRTLAVSSAQAHQFIIDIYVKNTCVRPMPLYSIPGLIDHH